jgi:DNA-binding GntR family transcriptional regulator
VTGAGEEGRAVTSSDLADGLGELPALPPRASTAEHAAQMLRSLIAQGRLLPGTKLREEQVSATFAISRNTVREAFRMLGHERLVEHTLHRGVYVRRVTPDDIRELYATRRLVEPLGIDAVIADGSKRAALRDVVDAAEAAADRDDWDAVGTADIDFHRTLISACDSSHLSTMFDRLLAELRLAFLGLPDRRSLHEPYLRRNRGLVTLIESGDRDAAKADLQDYLDVAERHLLATVQ